MSSSRSLAHDHCGSSIYSIHGTSSSGNVYLYLVILRRARLQSDIDQIRSDQRLDRSISRYAIEAVGHAS